MGKMTENRRKNISITSTAIEIFLEETGGFRWGNQNKNHYCFLNFDPKSLRITVRRWGYLRRPQGQDSKFWARIDSRELMYSFDNIFRALYNWSEFWDNFFFDHKNSELPPPSYPNAKNFADVVDLYSKKIFHKQKTAHQVSMF